LVSSLAAPQSNIELVNAARRYNGGASHGIQVPRVVWHAIPGITRTTIALAGTSGGAEVSEPLAAIRDKVCRYREAGGNDYKLSADYEEGLATYLTGDSEGGLALIAKAAEDGYFIPPEQAYLQTLYDEPGFASNRMNQETR